MGAPARAPEVNNKQRAEVQVELVVGRDASGALYLLPWWCNKKNRKWRKSRDGESQSINFDSSCLYNTVMYTDFSLGAQRRGKRYTKWERPTLERVTDNIGCKWVSAGSRSTWFTTAIPLLIHYLVPVFSAGIPSRLGDAAHSFCARRTSPFNGLNFFFFLLNKKLLFFVVVVDVGEYSPGRSSHHERRPLSA